MDSFLFMSRGQFVSKNFEFHYLKEVREKKSSFSGSDPAKLTESLFLRSEVEPTSEYSCMCTQHSIRYYVVLCCENKHDLKATIRFLIHM
jgi:hypothetical protein